MRSYRGAQPIGGYKIIVLSFVRLVGVMLEHGGNIKIWGSGVAEIPAITLRAHAFLKSSSFSRSESIRATCTVLI